MKSAALRQSFLDFFRGHGHEIVPSSPLVPANDPTLLFTNAGMVQFKDVFLGLETRPYLRAASCQRCVRAGGKHNDLENVGYTARHHTFFEMLGNFSFGDYFKREAIGYAWRFLTGELGIPAGRLWATVYAEDDEAARIWLEEIRIDPQRFVRIGDKPGGARYESDNFWAMGETGPCGPCSEIFYDHGPEVAGGPPGSPEADGDRYVEIWNLVFMQYDRGGDGRLTPLPKPSVDTGMGLERLAAVMQGVHSNYDIDLFRHLIRAAADVLGVKDLSHKSLRVVADHIRSSAFLITDGVLPSNEGRGYVLRRIIRRAVRHGRQLGGQDFFHRLVGPLVEEMGEAYPELAQARARVEAELAREEARFAETLEQGMRILEQEFARLPAQGGVLPGEVVFRLYDTYGFPADLTADIARERGLAVDMEGFNRSMAAQRERARAASQFAAAERLPVDPGLATEFTGYEHTEDDAPVAAIYVDGQAVETLRAGEEGWVVLERTPFYAESGGQVGDRGRLRCGDAVFDVADTRKLTERAFGHLGRLRMGSLSVGDRVHAEVDAEARAATACNHSATHLLHAALKEVLGPHVQQKGSLVAPGRLRFDFSHGSALTAGELAEVERRVNAEIRANREVETRVMALDEARAAGAVALFGEKYGERVRVVAMGGFSTELCGGTHVRRTGDIGLFKITAETGIAAGVRRIEAVTAQAALEYVNGELARLDRIAGLVKGGREDVEGRVEQLVARLRELEKEVEGLRAKLAAGGSADLAAGAREVAGVRVVAARLDGADPKALRAAIDRLKDRLGSAVVVLGAEREGKATLIAGVTRDLSGRVHAGQLVGRLAEHVGGKGGGRPDMAQAGGPRPEGLDRALEAVYGLVEAALTAA